MNAHWQRLMGRVCVVPGGGEAGGGGGCGGITKSKALSVQLPTPGDYTMPVICRTKRATVRSVPVKQGAYIVPASVHI